MIVCLFITVPKFQKNELVTFETITDLKAAAFWFPSELYGRDWLRETLIYQ